MSATPDGPQLWNRRLALLVAATFFMEFLDGTVLTTAIPSIADEFGVSPASVNITMTVYLLTVAMGIPLSGWLVERVGARRIFCLAIAMFTIASLLCALSPNLTMLTLSRILQGAGGALMVPVGSLVVLRGTPKPELLRATAYLVWPGLLAPVLAPLVGGSLTEYLSWHWIFLINLPLGAAAFMAALRLVPRAPTGRGRRLDWLGLVLVTLGVGALATGLELAGTHPEGTWTALGLAAGMSTLAAGVLWMRRAANPLFDLYVFSTRTFRATHTGGFIYRATISAVPFLLPLMFQEGFGWNPVHSGAMVAAVFIGNVGIKPVTTPLIRRLGFKPVLVFASLASAGTFALCAMITADTPQALIVALLVLSGVFRSIGFSAYASLQYADITPQQLTSANVVSATLVQLAAGTGIAVGALLLRVFDSATLPGPVLGDLLDSTAAGSDTAAYRGTFLSIALLMLLSTIDSMTLHRDAGAEVSGSSPN
ncbi:drug resistance transporter, EmrB/QacA subfamily [Arthrobacter subterraneus]|uniref:Drug resistance transporter, EmrB/QacA subfamily n=1 Tax=Arthrobacter subterraneus TaxID=335973 RepID=A0A1G8HBC3_9MICC|nr:MFS transporter [Arthrobacter subterraneus]SDI03974.1 drug resistance transporter, EmrB/QacA subfamily [Arthrobacter subterraneus]